MKRKVYAALKLTLGALFLLNGLGLAAFTLTRQHFPAALEWLWGTISYSIFFAAIRIAFNLVVGMILIRAGRQDLRHAPK